jgi:hypothetical protein
VGAPMAGVNRFDVRTVSVTPYRCVDCGGIQLQVGDVPQPGNCDRQECEGNHVEKCGPKQRIVLKLEK